MYFPLQKTGSKISLGVLNSLKANLLSKNVQNCSKIEQSQSENGQFVTKVRDWIIIIVVCKDDAELIIVFTYGRLSLKKFIKDVISGYKFVCWSKKTTIKNFVKIW